MINKYVYAICNDGPELGNTDAHSIVQAREQIRRKFDPEGDYEDLEWDEFVETLGEDKNIWIGDIYDVEEF